jgi:hypothetical protein
MKRHGSVEVAALVSRKSSSAMVAGKRKNNIWGTIIQEDSLNTDLLGVGVGRYPNLKSRLRSH